MFRGNFSVWAGGADTPWLWQEALWPFVLLLHPWECLEPAVGWESQYMKIISTEVNMSLCIGDLWILDYWRGSWFEGWFCLFWGCFGVFFGFYYCCFGVWFCFRCWGVLGAQNGISVLHVVFWFFGMGLSAFRKYFNKKSTVVDLYIYI